MKTNFAFLSAVVFLLGGCSGGGSGGGTSASTGTGVLSLPKATCGGSTCIQSVDGFETMTAGGSAETVLGFASDVYAYVQSTYIPAVNQKLAQVEAAFASEGYTACGGTVADATTGMPQIDQVPNGTHALGNGYSVVVTAGDKSAPVATTKKFVLSSGGTAFLEVQVRCTSTTNRWVYLRLNDGGKMYEAWGGDDGVVKTIIAASDEGTSRASLYFQGTSSSRFQVAAVASNFATKAGGSTVPFAISGGANFSSGSGVLDVEFLVGVNRALSTSGAPTATAYAADGSASVSSPVRHCYTDLASYTVTTTSTNTACGGLFTAPPTAYIRGGSRNASTWNLTDVGTTYSISTTF